MPDAIGRLVAPPAPVGDAQVVVAGDSETQRYLAELRPHLDVVIGEGNRLVDLGAERSRDLLELSVRMDRFRQASADLRSFVAANRPPPGLESTLDDLATHLETADVAIDDSISAIRGFNWNALAVAVERFSLTVQAIETLTETAATT